MITIAEYTKDFIVEHMGVPAEVGARVRVRVRVRVGVRVSCSGSGVGT